MYNLYDEYSETVVMSDDKSSVMFAEPEVKLIRTTKGVHLFTEIDTPPSWSSPLQTNCPYFFSPVCLYWFSKLDNWRFTVVSGDQLAPHLSPLLNSIHLFARRCGRELFCYLGTGSVVGFGPAPVDPRRLLLTYHINPKLRREAWVNFGGYAGWLLTIGQSDFNVRSYAEGAVIIERQWGIVSPILRLTRYEGDILQAATNDQEQTVISYLANSVSPERFSGRYDPTEQWVSFAREKGENWEVPVTTVISRKEALGIIESYLSTGRPIGICGID